MGVTPSKPCPKCGNLVSVNAYLHKYRCLHCNYTENVVPDRPKYRPLTERDAELLGWPKETALHRDNEEPPASTPEPSVKRKKIPEIYFPGDAMRKEEDAGRFDPFISRLRQNAGIQQKS